MKQNISSFVVVIMSFLGLFRASSFEGVISDEMVFYSQLIFVGLTSILILCNGIYKKNIKHFIIINMTLIIATLLNQFYSDNYLNRLSIGSYIPYFSLTLLLLIDFSNFEFRGIITLYNIIQYIIIIFGFLVVFNNQKSIAYLLSNYAMGYPELLRNMLFQNKPVFVFGSHSIASFIYISFALLNTYLFNQKKSLFYFISSILFVILAILTKSNTAYALSAVYLLYFLYVFYNTYRLTFVTLLPGIIFLTIYLIYKNFDYFTINFVSKNNGFFSRYSQNAVLSPNIEYISSHFLPMGLWINDNLYYSDSGFVLHMLKGSLIVTLSLYLSIYNYLKDMINKPFIYLPFFIIIILFEVGYPITLFYRFHFLFPLLILVAKEATKDKVIKSPLITRKMLGLY